jgi:hypothetical protein
MMTVVVAVVVRCTTGVDVGAVESLSHGVSSSGGKLGSGVDDVVWYAIAETSVHDQPTE